MVCSAAPVLLLATTLPLVGSPGAPVSQPAPSGTGGESGQQPDLASGAGESVLASVYVQLDFSSETWRDTLSSPLSLSPAPASSPPRTLTGLSLTTECATKPDGLTHCACLTGYQWNTSACSRHDPCHPPYNHQPCDCLVLSPAEAGYCQLLPPAIPCPRLLSVPGTLSLNSWLQMPGDTLNLTLLTSHETANLNWFLQRRTGSPILLQPGTQVSLASGPGQTVLSINNISHQWEGKYECCFEAQGFRWELSQVVRVPLRAADVTRLPDQLSVSCAASPGFQLSCCAPPTLLGYVASWSPGEGSEASLFNQPSDQCLVLAVQHCPAADTTYTCDLQSPGLTPLRVPISVTVIQDGDIACPEDSAAGAWNVTKAGYVAQAPCPVNRTGMVKRTCGPDGVWGPVQDSCTDTGLRALLQRAQLLWAGQGRPAAEVPRSLAELLERTGVVSSPSDLLALLGTVTHLAKAVADTGTQLNRSALEALLKTTDKVLDMDTSPLWTEAQVQTPSASSDLLLSVETLARSLRPQDHPFAFSLPNVQMQTQLLSATLPADYRVSFSTQPPLQALIPRHSLAPLVTGNDSITMTGLVLRKLDRLLPSNYGQGLGDSLYTTPGLVLAISIMAGGQAFNQGEVIMDFGDRDGTFHCVFWDHHLFQGNGGWSEEGCQAQPANASSAAQCICRHLTAFSILMSRHPVPESRTLDLLSHVGLGASILALLVCLGVYRLVWRVVVRNTVAYLRHAALLNMVLCLLAADTCFLGAALLPPGPESPLCLAAAFLCHFLYLATFFWMLAQALMLAHQLLFVFHQLSKRRVLSLMVVLGYLCPMGFAGAALGLYLPRGQYLGERACWLDEKGGVSYTFAGPVLVIVGLNGLVLAVTMLKLLRPSLSEGPQGEKRQDLLGVTKALLVLTPIFGLTWVLGLATLLEDDSTVPHYVFTILNASQGVFILWFGCLMDKKVQQALRRRFCRMQPPNSTISLATNETHILEHSKGRSENAR
ncbi:adhesion G protein-coupled receptor F3 [Phyllostomus discolor]|uniref:Adhesion G protein-coupled receptor F3 n=1 Tax=Phyllostomus discolor TaxID=89673 RepID=A0A6J2M077_9CHIR|nr:adhesion G-protein coupled receptor F3 isoform X1 [Phyllostomus discolor]KAF6101890.1 adhesion G protein-coupled receptor F3 [Phyllostomus discolor]